MLNKAYEKVFTSCEITVCVMAVIKNGNGFSAKKATLPCVKPTKVRKFQMKGGVKIITKTPPPPPQPLEVTHRLFSRTRDKGDIYLHHVYLSPVFTGPID